MIVSIAYLILAHDRPGHLARMIRALDCEGVTFFIHIDAKSDLGAFKQAVPPGRRVKYLEGAERVAVHWSGYSTVVATLNLMNAAMGSGESFVRYALLSGADFPIKNRHAIRDRLHSKTEFIRTDFFIDPFEDKLLAQRVRHIHLYDYPWLNPRTTPSPFLFGWAQRFLRLVPRGKFPDIPIYQGSAWWALTHDCVEYILTYFHEHPAYAKFHKYTCTPDETFFHSIVVASPFRRMMSHDVEAPQQTFDWDDYASHFIDWATPGIELPKVLDLSDLPRIQKSGAFFARKFQSPASDALLDRIEEMISTAHAVPSK